MPRLDFMEHGLLCRKCLYNIELKGPIKFNQKRGVENFQLVLHDRKC